VGGKASVEAAETVKIFINGNEVPSDTSPIIMNNRTLVPIRVISEKLGMDVKWDGVNRYVIITSKVDSLVNQPSGSSGNLSPQGSTVSTIRIFIDGIEVPSDTSPVIINQRTLVPIRVISERLGMNVDWQGDKVIVTSQNTLPVISIVDPNTNPTNPTPSRGEYEHVVSIMGAPIATADQLRTLLKKTNPAAPDLVDLYINIGREYGIRGDIAFCQAAKETGWWKYGGLVKLEQNNYCGLGATGSAATGMEDLNGADPSLVSYCKDTHGAIFNSPAVGVEAHIQHLYAYATTQPLPAGKKLVDPRFSILVKYGIRGVASNWVDLGGRWAVPGYDRNKYSGFEEAFQNGDTYGHSIIRDYYLKAL
jgi:hypothetical protein